MDPKLSEKSGGLIVGEKLEGRQEVGIKVLTKKNFFSKNQNIIDWKLKFVIILIILRDSFYNWKLYVICYTTLQVQ